MPSSLTLEHEPNYAAQVVELTQPKPHPNADRLELIRLFGYTVIVGKGEYRAGDTAVFFPAEAQLSHELASHANLYRKAELNADPTKTGYLEENRRVRSIRLRGTISSALLLPISSIPGVEGAPVGTVFDTVDGEEISRKYVIPTKEPRATTGKAREAALTRVDKAFFPEHVETAQYLRVADAVAENAYLIVTQKLHGTSARFGNIPVRRTLTWRDKLARFFGAKVKEWEYDTIAGSRRSVKDPKGANYANAQHFYETDIWAGYLQYIQNRIPQGYIVYGEIVGWTPDGAPIQKGHTYQVPQGLADFYVYRVAVVLPEGDTLDLTWDQVRTFCEVNGLSHVPELSRWEKSEFAPALYEEANLFEEYTEMQAKAPASRELLFRDTPVPLSTDGTGRDEGFVIRIETDDYTPTFLKVKNASHYAWETAQLDAGEVDLEAAEAVAA